MVTTSGGGLRTSWFFFRLPVRSTNGSIVANIIFVDFNSPFRARYAVIRGEGASESCVPDNIDEFPRSLEFVTLNTSKTESLPSWHHASVQKPPSLACSVSALQ